MDPRFSRRLLGVAVAISLSVSPFASISAFSAEYQARSNSLTEIPQRHSLSDNQLTAAVVLPPHGVSIQPQSHVLDGTLRTPGDNERTLRNGLVHSSKGMQALAAGDRVGAQKELETARSILSQLPKAATSDELRLRLIEETALLHAALSGALSGQEADSPTDEREEEENEADTEAAPDLVVSEEEPVLASPGSEILSIPALDPSDFDVPIELNEQVKAYILYYQTRKSGVMSRAFERSGRFLPMMRRIFRDHGIPQDLVNLAYVESGFNYRAYSKAKASGIWQFIKPTGNRYGMRVNYWLDERRDPEKATHAAAAYLKDLYEMFQSWPLALAAYNAGEYRIQRAIEQQGTTDFWSLRLPKETELFVPAFMAVTIIAQDPDRYGFAAPVEEPWNVERVTVPGAIELRSVARTVGVSSDLIRDLNPALMRGVTPIHASEYEILLPPGAKEILLANLDQLPRYSYREPVRTAVKWHRVRKGETLELIASRHRTVPAELAGFNGLKVGDRLKVGALLRLSPAAPASKGAVVSVRGAGSRGRPMAAKKAVSSARSAAYIVKRGDTLSKVARIYGVTPDNLRQWNGLKRQAKLQPGQTLQVVAQTAKSNRDTGRGDVPASITPVRYRVRRGDTLWEIARVHDVTPDELRRWNDLGHKTPLLVGQELRIRVSES
ncbi:MAG: LysM peptidoglycan-binding domain-containing protein [Candidatus Methylomirabilis oxygeniifera]|uniref:Putative Membrane-bound lytic murein transglycosylase D n=1 Tax=Methylomirabilis oxygeniifera TaxID=671143 RepID=D5ML04_METO1|nr:MAG: LysM peptidoglycan-binding domain-containing protein [Candidatus Methylomirabilis oxyfera]CBE69844.1 putative Membrane-bound lytic murein transglycosylase D [Candidatus Methylomirabilis oxyfera]